MIIPIGVEHEPHNRQETPACSFFLLLAFIVAWLYTGVVLDEAARNEMFYRFGVSRFEYQWWAPLTCTFLHAGLMHLIGNSLLFWIYGASLEKLIGSGKFLILYLAGAFLSTNMQLLTMTELQVHDPCVGASGAVSAVMGCFFVMLPKAKLRCLFFSPISFRPIVIKLPAWLLLGLWFGGQLLYTLGFMGAMGNIAFWAHVAGFGVGAVLGSLFHVSRRRRLEKWMRQVREPLSLAWEAFRNGNVANARQVLDETPDTNPDSRAVRTLLEAQVAFAEDRDKGAGELLKAFRQARDYRNDELTLMLYLHMCQLLSPEDIPPIMHRQAGFAALADKEDRLAAWAFCQSLGHGITEREEQMLMGMETALRERLDSPAQAETLAALRAELAAG